MSAISVSVSSSGSPRMSGHGGGQGATGLLPVTREEVCRPA